MAICVIGENPKVERRRLRAGHAAGRAERRAPAALGAIFQVAGPADPGSRVISVWRSREDFERFRDERVRPAWAEAGVSLEDMRFTIFEAHSFMAGDLSGAAQRG